MDLVMTASGTDREVYYRDQLIKLKRGQLIVAERIWSRRWGWSRGRYRTFARNCLDHGEIRYHRQDHRISILSIVKYNTYNPPVEPGHKADETTDRTTDETTDRTKKNKDIKKVLNKGIRIKPLARTKKKSEPKIFFDFKQRKFLNIKIEDKAGWLDAYPACDIDQELRKMREWLLANPKQKKNNYRRFITNWLSRTQDKGGSKLNYSGGSGLSHDDQRKKKLDDWVKKPLEE